MRDANGFQTEPENASSISCYVSFAMLEIVGLLIDEVVACRRSARSLVHGFRAAEHARARDLDQGARGAALRRGAGSYARKTSDQAVGRLPSGDASRPSDHMGEGCALGRVHHRRRALRRFTLADPAVFGAPRNGCALARTAPARLVPLAVYSCRRQDGTMPLHTAWIHEQFPDERPEFRSIDLDEMAAIFHPSRSPGGSSRAF